MRKNVIKKFLRLVYPASLIVGMVLSGAMPALAQYKEKAENIRMDTSNFDNNLSPADDTAQKVADTVDEMSGVGGGDVTAAANMTDNAIIRGDGGAKGVQDSSADLDDGGVLTTAEFIETAGSNGFATNDAFLTQQTGIDGTTTIPLTSLYINVESDGGDVTVTANPRIAPGTRSGDILVLEGTSDVDKLIFADGNGVSMSTSVTLGNEDVLAYKWNDIKSEWIMQYSDTK